MSIDNEKQPKPIEKTLVKMDEEAEKKKLILPKPRPKIEITKPNPTKPPIDPVFVKALNAEGMNIGYDGVVHVFETSRQNPKEFYMNSQKFKNNFKLDSSPVKYDKINKDGHSSVITVKRNEFEEGFKNVEATIYLKVEKPVTDYNYQRLSFSWGQTQFGLAENMPTYEINYPTLSHPEPTFHIVFTPEWFLVNKDTKLYFSGDRLTENKWLAVKFVCLTIHDNSTTWMGIWVDDDPLDLTVKPPLPKNKFKFMSESVYTGFIGDDHPPCKVWRSDFESFRIDGFEKVTVMNVSVREIETSDFNPFTEEYLREHSEYTLLREGIDGTGLKTFEKHNSAIRKD